MAWNAAHAPAPFVAPDDSAWAPHDECRFSLGDETTLCPHCQARTEWSENADGSQNHTCLRCGFRFVGDFEWWDEQQELQQARLAKGECPECGTPLKKGYRPNNFDPGDVDPVADCPGCGWGY